MLFTSQRNDSLKLCPANCRWFFYHVVEMVKAAKKSVMSSAGEMKVWMRSFSLNYVSFVTYKIAGGRYYQRRWLL